MKKLAPILSLALLYIITSCSQPVVDGQQINTKAALPASLNFKQACPFVITSMINRKQGTMSTLYGNDAARNALLGKAQPNNGEVLALVTWKQQEDPHWFGGLIPGKLVSVEWAKTQNDQNHSFVYQRFDGASLQPHNDTTGNSSRLHYISILRPSVMP
ncbi:cytochrome P460 family protein [Mucilaginibacter agri]|uniref:Cytochrome P460 domain-containing protein n=1 Tax=Mucilaginibacter agri TaxID=2695265 RepID=A0A965ZIE6_9SPHI|nr:cytochrome P460 family protein [Mucilaginibacter agri]NCD71673.1 hypothetical protein [Mucilaginibacter agri]